MCVCVCVCVRKNIVCVCVCVRAPTHTHKHKETMFSCWLHHQTNLSPWMSFSSLSAFTWWAVGGDGPTRRGGCRRRSGGAWAK
jgi:hypothetical protein